MFIIFAKKIMKKVVIPLKDKILSPHFGVCDSFAFYKISENRIEDFYEENSPKHEPDKIPYWIVSQDVTDVIVSGIGQKAIDILNKENINIFAGINYYEPEIIIQKFIDNDLKTSMNPCDH
jgi:predicted Fe-Mo cluster-binding NifX family protein